MKYSDEPLSPGKVAEELSPVLLGYLRRYVGDPDLAEDLLQETLVRVVRGLPGFAERSSLKTWAFSIATRVAADHFRRPLNRLQIVEFDESSGSPDADMAVDDQLVVDEMNSCIRQVIDSLPADYRAALILHDLEGETGARVAEICGCSLATAKIRLHRARLRLKEALRQECVFYRDRNDVLHCDRKCPDEDSS